MNLQHTDVDWPEVLQVVLYVAVVTLQLPVHGIEAGLLWLEQRTTASDVESRAGGA